MPIMDRLVVDTNVFVSAAVFPNSVPRRAVDKGLHRGHLLFSEPTMNELAEVFSRPKFDEYVDRKERELFLAQLKTVAEFVPIIQLVRECRDPKNDKFLDLALNGRADVIVTGDTELLVLNPWRSVTILRPRDYLTR